MKNIKVLENATKCGKRDTKTKEKDEDSKFSLFSKFYNLFSTQSVITVLN